MDIQKIKKKYAVIACIAILLIVALVLYHSPLFSGKSLGLDTPGHLSKISYIKEFGLGTSWNMDWYNGIPFLQFYSPLYYQLASFFSNIIFGAELLPFLSILLTAIGIFFLINYYTKNKTYSVIFSLFFLSVLCTSYYFISVGNNPYVFALFTIPFTLLFLEKSLKEKKYNFLLYSLFFVIAYLAHIFIALVLFMSVFIRITLHVYMKKKHFLKNFIKENFIYLSIPLLMSCFWFLEFLTKTKSFVGDGIGYVPSLSNLFGFGNYIIWGKSPGEIGILLALFALSLFFLVKYFIKKDEGIMFYSINSFIFLALLGGILGRFYPTGVGAIRFILPFTIIASIFCGIIFAKQFKNKKWMIIALSIVLIGALIWNYTIINENYIYHSYSSNYDRFGGMTKYVYTSPDFPAAENFTNYRFGTSRYVFAETLNYEFPWQSQTWGYFDQGMLNPSGLYNFRDVVWSSDPLNETIKYLDDYAIKYFEIGGPDLAFDAKFNESPEFTLIMQDNTTFSDYAFKIYRYNEAKPIVSIISGNATINTENYSLNRPSPDELLINYSFSGKEQISFKESFHNSWKAKDIVSGKEIPIKETPLGFMTLQPEKGSDQINIYQTKTTAQKGGIAFSILGIILAFAYSFKNKLNFLNEKKN